MPNRVFRFVAAWLPGFAVLIHRGRKSGRVYRTPVKLFRNRDGFVIACVYGADSGWVRNVIAAGGGELVHLGRRVSVERAELVRDESRRLVPWIVRPIFGLLQVTDYVQLASADAVAEADPVK